MEKNPANIKESINELKKKAIEMRDKDASEALCAAEKAVRLFLNLCESDNIFDYLNNNQHKSVTCTKDLADLLHVLAECEIEASSFEKAIFYLDKARALYEKDDDKAGMCEVLISLGKTLVHIGEFQSAIEINLQALKATEEIKDVKRMMSVMNNIGFNYWNLGDNKKALAYLSNSLELKKRHGDDSDIAKSLNNLGIVYNAMGDYLSALKCYNEACRIVEQLNQRKGVAILYMNIGLLYVKLSNLEKAIEFLNKSLAINKEIDYKKGEGECYVNLALVYRVDEKYEEALKFAKLGLEVAEKLGDKKVIAYAYQEIFKTLEEKKEYVEALDYAWKSYNLRKEIDHKQGVVEIAHHLCRLFIEIGDLEKVPALLEEAFKTCDEANLQSYKISNYYIVAKYFEKLGDYKRAAESYRIHIEMNENHYSEEAKIKVGNLQAIFEIEQARRESEIYKLKNIDLAEANKKLEVMNQEKNEFLNLVSHDLKNPLNSIFGFSTLLVEDAAMLSKEEVSDFAANINISSMAMLDLINEILNSDLMDSGRYQVKNELVDLNSIINSLIGMNKFQLKHKEIKVVFEESSSSHLFSDGNILKQIISNLFSNAIKFSMPGSNVYLNIYHNENKSSTFIEVKDEGPGLTPEDKEKLFVKFAKLSAQPTAGESSTGLGLSIVKKLTDIIGGVIICESEPGKGTKFTVEVPLTPSKK